MNRSAVGKPALRTHCFTLQGVAEGFLDWYPRGPRDIGGATRAALSHLARHGTRTRREAPPGPSGQLAMAR